ncbi:hypothetical protein [Neolewinella antarctica]|uniref:DUF4832 domain-containing protein n=1 Tax=Neolewinella antarctica TaxID=442734 RepID=A0ABX0X8F1_9BACT|nr:hypothetical protein [Neolewinella antarctica]NJC25497.1 hypothetical protein [Neolewinella antarctica]
MFLRSLVLLALFVSAFSCDKSELVDLSQYTVKKPADGIGHYVYALTMPPSIQRGEKLPLAMEWRTVGPAVPQAQQYDMEVRLSGPETKTYFVNSAANTIGEYHLTNWLQYDFVIPSDFPAGEYVVSVRIMDEDGAPQVLGYKDDRLVGESFYRLTTLRVTE